MYVSVAVSNSAKEFSSTVEELDAAVAGDCGCCRLSVPSSGFIAVVLAGSGVRSPSDCCCSKSGMEIWCSFNSSIACDTVSTATFLASFLTIPASLRQFKVDFGQYWSLGTTTFFFRCRVDGLLVFLSWKCSSSWLGGAGRSGGVARRQDC